VKRPVYPAADRPRTESPSRAAAAG
jgi:hypothetical protein